MRENLLPDVPDPAPAGPGRPGSGAPIQEQPGPAAQPDVVHRNTAITNRSGQETSKCIGGSRMGRPAPWWQPACCPRWRARRRRPARTKVFLSMSYVGNDWQAEASNMVKAMAAHPSLADKIDLQVQVAGPNAQKQIQQINAMVQAGAKAIVIFPISPTALNQVVRSACAKRVLVFAYDGEITEPCVHNVTIDQEEAGRVTAQWLADKLGGKGRVVMVTGVPGTSVDTQRTDAREEGVRQVSGHQGGGRGRGHVEPGRGAHRAVRCWPRAAGTISTGCGCRWAATPPTPCSWKRAANPASCCPARARAPTAAACRCCRPARRRTARRAATRPWARRAFPTLRHRTRARWR